LRQKINDVGTGNDAYQLAVARDGKLVGVIARSDIIDLLAQGNE
jgi:CBS domain-containing protein